VTPTAVAAARFTFQTPTEVENLPDLEWLIPEILPKPCFAVLYGEPGCGKTFVALSMALTLTNGGDWVGRTLVPANVLYFAAEGIYGLKTRITAFRSKYGIDDKRVRFSNEPINVLENGDIDKLVADLRQIEFTPDLIIFDTLARVTVGADENNAKDMGRAVAGLDRLKKAFQCAVLVIPPLSGMLSASLFFSISQVGGIGQRLGIFNGT